MHLKDEFITHMSGSDQILVDTSGSFSGLARSNKTAAFIVDCLKNDTDKEAIISALLERYDVSREIVEADVDKIIDKLRKINAIED